MKHKETCLSRLLPGILFLTCSTAALFAQSSDIDLNEYYHSPVATGVYYQPLSGMGNRALADFSIQEIAGEARLSFLKLPELQPFIRGGVADYSFIGNLDELNQDWTHRYIFAGPGIAYTTRISREFELGAELFGAISQSYFSNLYMEGVEGSLGQLNILAGAAARLALNPSYNTSISVTPSLRYLYGLGPLDAYNGLTFGVGFGVTYRFGEDPDSAASIIRALKLEFPEISPIFASMQSVYVDNPITTVTLENTDDRAVENLQVAFYQSGFMDSPTTGGVIPRLAPGERVEAPVYALFNGSVFFTNGITPLTGEVILSYSYRGREVEQRGSFNFDLHDRNALIWDDDRKAGAFITPSDSAIRNYASYIRSSLREQENSFLPRPLQTAMQAYAALAGQGILYQIDPTSAFAEVQENNYLIDSVSLPRETLSRLTGDCDDLTVLYCTLLESAGVHTGIVTVPGHIYAAVNTEVPAREYRMVHPDRDRLLIHDDQVWVLVEITMLGRQPFMKAWETGMEEWKAFNHRPEARAFHPTSEAQRIYRPVGLVERDLGLQYLSASRLSEVYAGETRDYAESLLEPYRLAAEDDNNERSWNRYGIEAARMGQTDVARRAFDRAAALAPNSTAPLVNLGILEYLEKQYDTALETFTDAEKKIDHREDAKPRERLTVYSNIVQACKAIGDTGKAKDYIERIAELDPDKALQLSVSIVETSCETGRAAEINTSGGIIFAEIDF